MSRNDRYHLRQRELSRSAQGDIGEASAIEWLTSKGALVWLPVGHSPDVDLMAELEDQILRIQVKTSTYRVATPRGKWRWDISIATNGGNQSWSGLSKEFDPGKVDYLFALTGDGRRWFIPAHLIEARRGIKLGGAKYSEFEIEQGAPFEALVYPDGNTNRIAPIDHLGECQSGQMDQTVNLTAMPTQVRILPPPSTTRQVILRPKRQLTIPRVPCEEAGLSAGDRLRVRADGPGRIVFEQIEERVDETPAEPPV